MGGTPKTRDIPEGMGRSFKLFQQDAAEQIQAPNLTFSNTSKTCTQGVVAQDGTMFQDQGEI